MRPTSGSFLFGDVLISTNDAAEDEVYSPSLGSFDFNFSKDPLFKAGFIPTSLDGAEDFSHLSKINCKVKVKEVNPFPETIFDGMFLPDLPPQLAI